MLSMVRIARSTVRVRVRGRVGWASFVGTFVVRGVRGVLRLVGASRALMVRMVGRETLVCVAAGVLVGALAPALTVGGSWAALHRLVGPVPLGPLLLDGPWVLFAALGLLCAVVALVVAVAPASLALRAGPLRMAGRRE